MSQCITFITGLITGMYVAQTYPCPKVSVIITKVCNKLSEFDKECKEDNKECKDDNK
jgi:hypothetical protein